MRHQQPMCAVGPVYIVLNAGQSEQTCICMDITVFYQVFSLEQTLLCFSYKIPSCLPVHSKPHQRNLPFYFQVNNIGVFYFQQYNLPIW